MTEINPFRLKFWKWFFKEDKIDYQIIHHTQLGSPEFKEQINGLAGLIATGSRDNLSNPQVLKERQSELEFIRQYSRPYLGICFGHQMIGAAYGARVQQMQKQVYDSESNRVLEIRFIENYPLLKDGKQYKTTVIVEENHHDEVIPTEIFLNNVKNYASTTACQIQAIKHKEKPIFGVQFHPDTTKEEFKADALIILRNFFEISVDCGWGRPCKCFVC